MTAGSGLADGLHVVPAGKLAAVVTSLEMRRPPDPREPPARRDLGLRRVAAPRPDWYRALFRRVGEPWLWSSRLLLDGPALAVVIGDAAVEVYVLEHEGQEPASSNSTSASPAKANSPSSAWCRR